MTAILIGVLVGFTNGGIFGALLGAFIGSWVNRKFFGGSGPAGIGGNTQQRQRAQTAFFKATFLVMGRVAKADGHVSEHEIDAANAIMANMRLSSAQRQDAINLFNEGKKQSSDIESTLKEFRQVAGSSTLIPMFLEIQLSAAYADGSLSPSEQAVFRQICDQLGVGNFVFEKIHQRFQAQRSYYQHGGYQQGGGFGRTSGSDLKQAYQVLGVESEATDSEVKRAYRKLMSQHHPDKLVAKGLPEEMMEVAKQKTQEIQGAYDQVREYRKIRNN
ncbi:molecular chaperone DjlA [Endozoicomonas sp. (ex Bugula neritina AB1)]|nr:molecular chaperone DjlA [Endozoicomonas sp. (ex Bugula neritina AB1)]